MPRSEGQLPTVDDLLVAFARDLRELRERAGNPTYRELARRAHYSAATLSDAAGGKKLPTLMVTLAFVGACGGDPVAWERRWRANAAELAARRTRLRTEAVADDGKSPYVGLAAFQAEDAGRFFGREKLIDELRKLLITERFVSVFGASGVGKSSLLRAGLVPAIQEASPVALMTPGAHPVEECAVALARVTGEPAALICDELSAGGLHLRVRQTVPDGVDLVLVIDQFEEIFTLCQDTDERGRFLDSLLAAAQAPTSRIRVVVGVRADFYPHCAQHPALAEALRRGQLVVGGLTSEELQRAITQPAIDAAYTLERALLAAVVADSAGNPAVLPLVSHALLETWRRRHGTTLTLSGYQAAGGIQDALAQTAERTYHAFTAGQQHQARAMFLRLIALGDGTEDTRRRVDRTELDYVEGLDEVLDALVTARLITVDRDSVDITHEALIHHWPRLRQWLTENRDGLRAQRQLTEAAMIWDSVNQDDGALYRGTRLELAREWVTSCRPSLSHRERAFFDRSVEVRRREALATKHRTRRLWQLIALLVVLTVALAGTTAFSLVSQQTVAGQRDQAAVQSVVDQIPTIALGNPALAGELALAVYRLDPSPHNLGLLLAASANTRANSLFGANVGPLPVSGQVLNSATTLFAYVDQGTHQVLVDSLNADGTGMAMPGELPAVTSAVNAFALSPDGRLLAVAHLDGMLGQPDPSPVDLWDISDRAHPKLLRTYHPDTRVEVAFSPDGRFLLISSDGSTGSGDVDGTKVYATVDLQTWIWDTADLAAEQPVAVLPDTMQARMFAADGGTVITTPIPADARDPKHQAMDSGLIGPAKIWDLKAATSGRPGKPFETNVLDLYDGWGLSADGQLLADAHAAETAGTLRLWRRTGNTLTKVAELTTGPTPGSPAFSPDGKFLAWREGDNTIVVWDVSDPAKPKPFATMAGTTSNAFLVRFTTDGKLTVIESGDILTRGLNADDAAGKVCAALKKPRVPRDKWPVWNSFFPSMDVPDPCR